MNSRYLQGVACFTVTYRVFLFSVLEIFEPNGCPYVPLVSSSTSSRTFRFVSSSTTTSVTAGLSLQSDSRGQKSALIGLLGRPIFVLIRPFLFPIFVAETLGSVNGRVVCIYLQATRG